MNGCKRCGDNLAVILGRLGYLVWLRCRACGTDYSVSVDQLSSLEIDVITDELEDRENA